MSLDWNDVIAFYEDNGFITTKNKKTHPVKSVTSTAIIISLPSGDQTISRKNLEKAVSLIENGGLIEGPLDYRRLVGDERPSYAYGVLRDLNFV